MVLKFEDKGRRGKRRTRKYQIADVMKKHGLMKDDAHCTVAHNRDKWRQAVKTMTTRNPANYVDGEENGSKLN